MPRVRTRASARGRGGGIGTLSTKTLLKGVKKSTVITVNEPVDHNNIYQVVLNTKSFYTSWPECKTLENEITHLARASLLFSEKRKYKRKKARKKGTKIK
jgi:hypothetical protein